MLRRLEEAVAALSRPQLSESLLLMALQQRSPLPLLVEMDGAGLEDGGSSCGGSRQCQQPPLPPLQPEGASAEGTCAKAESAALGRTQSQAPTQLQPQPQPLLPQLSGQRLEMDAEVMEELREAVYQVVREAEEGVPGLLPPLREYDTP